MTESESEDRRRRISGMDVWMAVAMLASLLLLIFAATQSQAQTLIVLHGFTDQGDGGFPLAGVTLDQQGRIYGTAEYGGSYAAGVVYRLVHDGQAWVLSPIYSFGSQQHDGTNPLARVIFGPDGLLYGTTTSGGADGAGTVFSLQPPATACKSTVCPWLETVLYSFTGGVDGGTPNYGDLAFDQAGNIYGTTTYGGSSREGVVFKLTRSGSGWTESVLWNFRPGFNDGGYPLGGVIFDHAGNLYGTTSSGGAHGDGIVYELSYTQSGWSEMSLYSFTSNDNGSGAGGLIMDAHGDLFGITGGFETGAAYELVPQNGNWSFTLLQTFFGGGYPPTLAAPTFDSQGSLYGPLPSAGNGFGEIFKLTPSGNQWIYIPFYQFIPNEGSGVFPVGAVTFDANGNMYGTTEEGGTGGYGTVWEITP